MRISDWSSDVCSSDLAPQQQDVGQSVGQRLPPQLAQPLRPGRGEQPCPVVQAIEVFADHPRVEQRGAVVEDQRRDLAERIRSEEHTSELQSLMRISYAVFCLNKKTMKLMNMT